MTDYITPTDIPLHRCSKCKTLKPATTEYFCRRLEGKSGFSSHCRTCKSKRKNPIIRAAAGYKYCSKCKTEKEFDKFSIDKSRPGGYCAYCRECHRQYNQKNKKRMTEISRKWNMSHPERQKERMTRYLSNNKDKASEKKLAWRKKNKDRIVETTRQYREKNRDVFRAISNRRRSFILNSIENHTAADIKHQYTTQEGKCYYCGCEVGKKYHVDHVIPLSRGGTNGPKNLVIACPPCNLSKSDKLLSEWEGYPKSHLSDSH